MEDVFRSAHSGVASEADNEREFKKRTRWHDLQIPRSPCTPSNYMFKCSSPLRSTTCPRSRVVTERSGFINPNSSKTQVYLYNWFLTRVGGDHTENGTAENGVQVALEGYTTSDLLDHEKFRTAPIESRIEKCKLRTVDGLYILLKGAIDEQRTYGNGFPFHVIHFFLTGFPFNWNHVINIRYGQPSLNMSVLLANKEKEYAWQEKVETLNSDYSGIHMEDTRAGKSSLLELEEKISEVTSPRESLVRCSKRGRHVSQPIRSSKRFKCGNLSIKSEPKVFSPFGGLLENSNISKESRESMKQINSGSFPDEAKLTRIPQSVAKENDRENQTNGQFSSSEDSVHQRIDKNEAEQLPMVNMYLDQLENNCISGGEQTLLIHIPVSEFPDTSCKTGKFISRDRSHTKKNGMYKSSQASRDTLCGEITEEAGKKISVAKHKTHREKIFNTRALGEECKNYTKFPSNSEFRIIPNKIISSGTDGKGQLQVDCLGAEAVDFDFICTNEYVLSASAEKKPSSLLEIHLNNDGNKPVKQVNTSGTERLGQPKERTMCTDQPPELSEAFVCNQTTVDDGVLLNCNDIDATYGTNPYKVASEIKHGGASKHCTEIGDDFIHMKEDVFSASVENKLSSSPENHLNNDVNKPVKQVNKSGTNTRGKAKKRTRFTDQSSEPSEAFVCNQTTVNDCVMLKCNDIDATCGTNLYQIASEIEQGMASRHCTEAGDDFINMKKDVLSASAENKPSSSLGNDLNDDVNKFVKQVNMSGTNRGVQPKNRARYTDQPPELSEASACYQTVVNDGVVLECNDIDATCCTNRYQVESEIEHGLASNHCTKIGNDCREGKGDGEEGSVQTSKTITEINMQTQTRKRKFPGSLPPLPPRRVHTTPEEVAKAFGLKTSRSGRLLVPPLAHWCNQTIAYDLDGGIIAILDASSQRNEDNGSLNFKPPEQKDAIKIQKKLCNAANETIRRLKMPKRHARI